MAGISTMNLKNQNKNTTIKNKTTLNRLMINLPYNDAGFSPIVLPAMIARHACEPQLWWFCLDDEEHYADPCSMVYSNQFAAITITFVTTIVTITTETTRTIVTVAVTTL